MGKKEIKLIFSIIVLIMFIAPLISLFLENPATGFAVKDTVGGFKELKNKNATLQNEKLTILFFGQSDCQPCVWEKQVLEEISEEIETVTLIEYDFQTNPPSANEYNIFQQFSPQGIIPLIIIGEKYYRIGANPTFNRESEKNAIIELIHREIN